MANWKVIALVSGNVEAASGPAAHLCTIEELLNAGTSASGQPL
jgi:hypothetical protein